MSTETDDSNSTPFSTALAKFDAILTVIAKDNNPRRHKRLKFINRNLIDLPLVERKLHHFLHDSMSPERLRKLYRSLDGCTGEARVCEYLLELIRFSEARVQEHLKLVEEIIRVMHKATKEANEKKAEWVVDKFSLTLYDSMQYLVSIKRIIRQVATIYQIPYYYDTEKANIRVRSGVMSTYKNLNTTLDDLQTVTEALWVVRNSDVLEQLDND